MKWLRSRFRKDEGGNATVEFVLWLPLIMGIVVGAFDLNIMLMTQAVTGAIKQYRDKNNPQGNQYNRTNNTL